MKRRLACTLAVSACAVLSGCYQRIDKPEGATYSFSPVVPILMIVVGLVLIGMGVVVFARRRFMWGAILALLGLGAAVAVAPGMYLDHVVVGKDEFTSRHGFWWSPVIHRVRYDDLAAVDVIVEEKRQRGRRTFSYSLNCISKTGQQEIVPLGDIMREALTELAVKFQGHNIPANIPTEMPR